MNKSDREKLRNIAHQIQIRHYQNYNIRIEVRNGTILRTTSEEVYDGLDFGYEEAIAPDHILKKKK